MVKNLPANAGNTKDVSSTTGVGKISLEEGMATHSTILAGKIQWTEESGRLQSMELQRVGCD